MKKFLDLLGRRKRSQENFYSLYDTSLPNINNHFSETNIYKYYTFDSDVYDTRELSYEILLNSKVEGTSICQECHAQSLSSSCLNTSTERDLPDFQAKNDLPLTKTNLNSVGSVTEMEQEGKNKTRKNIYLININNSKYFHIGLQKTINVYEKPLLRDTVQGCESQNSFKNYFSQLTVDFQKLLDCEERLTEKYISLISLDLDDHWKEFLKYLGLDVTLLETLESRNNNNRILSVYDGLHKYISLFPNTSLGFVIHALSESHQVVVVEKLAQELET